MKVFEGAYVGGFAERSSAKEAGIEKGDVIVAVNGVKIKSSSALQEQISKYRPGDKVELTINRNGSTKKFTVELRNAQGSTKVVKGGDSAEVMGAAFKALNDEQKRKLGVSYGIEVTGLTSGKLKDAGIKKGFIIMIVNNQKIKDCSLIGVKRLLKVFNWLDVGCIQPILSTKMVIFAPRILN